MYRVPSIPCAFVSKHRGKTGTCWRHQMDTFSALLALCAGKSRSPVNSPHKGQWRRALIFFLVCAWINGWANNCKAGDLRRHRANYDVTVVKCMIWVWLWFQNISVCLSPCWFALSQWETALFCNDVSHWLAESLESALSAQACYIPPCANGTEPWHEKGHYNILFKWVTADD